MSTDPGGLILAAVVTAVVSLLVMESYQTTPWLADKLIQWSVRLRYTDNSERAKVRGEELMSLLEDLPTLFKLPTASGFLFRALVYRFSNRRSHASREVRAVRRSLGARFRIALAKAGLVLICTATLFVIELAFLMAVIDTRLDFLILIPFGLVVGISAASEVVAQPSRLHPGFVGGITYALSIFMVGAGYAPFSSYQPQTTPAGLAFGVATALVGALIAKFKKVGFIFGVFANFAGMALALIALTIIHWSSLSTSRSEYEQVKALPTLPTVDLWMMVGLGFAAGTLAGFAVAVERITRSRRSLEPSTAIGEPSPLGDELS